MEINLIYNAKQYRIRCEWGKTRNGFKHTATLEIPFNNNGSVFPFNDSGFLNAIEYREIDSAKCFYLNRTWESYQFQSVIRKLIRKHFNNEFESVMDLIEKK